MALTAPVAIERFNPRGARCISSTFFSNENYVTGGLTLTPGVMGLTSVFQAVINVAPVAGTTAYMAIYDTVNSKVKLYWVDTTVDGSPLLEVPNATALGALYYGIVAFGR